MSEFLLGTIMPWPVDFAPAGWAFCDGRLQSISQNQALYSLIGNMYGGNGIVTFALPDLRGRVITCDNSLRYIGYLGGYEMAYLNLQNLPSHSHSAQSYTPDQAETNDPTIGSIVFAKSARNAYATSGQQVMQAGTSAPTGQGQPVSVVQPFIALNYIICTQGVFPSRLY